MTLLIIEAPPTVSAEYLAGRTTTLSRAAAALRQFQSHLLLILFSRRNRSWSRTYAHQTGDSLPTFGKTVARRLRPPQAT